MLIEPDEPFVNINCPMPLRTYGDITYLTDWESQTAGSSTAYGLQSKISATGEYLERKYLYMEVKPEGTFNYQDLSDEELSFYKYQKDFKNVQFIFARNISSKELIRIPYEMVYLDHVEHGLGIFRDSSGSALGETRESAMVSAFLEFFERQALILSWQIGRYIGRIDPNEALEHCNGQAKQLLTLFIKSGEVKIVINTIESINAHSGIILYKSCGTVKYCVASGCSLSLEELVNKLILELWQSYLFILINHTQKKDKNETGLDYYKNNFIACNIEETFEQWNTSEYLDNLSIKKSIKYDINEFISKLKYLEGNFYIHEMKTKDGFYFSKAFSPQYFLHMSSNNLEYIPDFCKENYNVITLRKKEIPFP